MAANDPCVIHLPPNADGAINDKLRALAGALFQVALQTPADAPGIIFRALVCLSGGDAIELRTAPAVRAGHHVAAFEFTDLLLELVPALRTGDPDLQAAIGHADVLSLDGLTAPANAESGEGAKAPSPGKGEVR